jgi:hypothetical protein
MSEPTGAPLADGVVRMWWRPGLGSAPGCVDIGSMDNGHVVCKLVSLSQAVTLVTTVAWLTGDPRPMAELVRLLRIAHVAGPWREPTTVDEAAEPLGPPIEHPEAVAAARPLPEPVDGDLGVGEDLRVLR